MERILSNDYVYTFWFAQGGSTLWMVKRKEVVLLFMILSNQAMRIVPFMQYDNNSLEMLHKVFNGLGFTEFPVQSEYKFMDEKVKKIFEDQLAIFDKERERVEAERMAAQKEKQGKTETPIDTPETGINSPDNVVNINDSRLQAE